MTMRRLFNSLFSKRVRENTKVRDNVHVVLTDIVTGKTQRITAHNIPLNHSFAVFASWYAGVNNTGQNAILPPSQIELDAGSGTVASTDTGPFVPIPNTLTSISYVQANSPVSGTTTLVFQIAAGTVTTEVTGAFLRDISGNGFAHTLFATPFTPSSTQNITIVWENTFSS